LAVLKRGRSVFGNTVVLSSEGLTHILLRHPELGRVRELEDLLISTIEAPDLLVEGRHGEHVAVRHIPDLPLKAKFLTVVYDEGGEVRTAFATSKPRKIEERGVIWRG